MKWTSVFANRSCLQPEASTLENTLITPTWEPRWPAWSSSRPNVLLGRNSSTNFWFLPGTFPIGPRKTWWWTGTPGTLCQESKSHTRTETAETTRTCCATTFKSLAWNCGPSSRVCYNLAGFEPCFVKSSRVSSLVSLPENKLWWRISAIPTRNLETSSRSSPNNQLPSKKHRIKN